MSVFLHTGPAAVLRRDLLPAQSTGRGCPSFRTVLAALTDVWDNRRGRSRGTGGRAVAGHRLTVGDPGLHGSSSLFVVPGSGSLRKSSRPLATAAGRAVPSLRSGVGRVRRCSRSSPSPRWSTSPCATPSGAGRRRRPALVAMAVTTLDAMAAGGIHDHLGGGFARYSTDDRMAGAPLREDALRPGRPVARVPPRLAGDRQGRLPPGGRRASSAYVGRDLTAARAACTRPRTPTRKESRAGSTSGPRTEMSPVAGGFARGRPPGSRNKRKPPASTRCSTGSA